MLATYDSLDNAVLNFLKEKHIVVTHQLQTLPQGTETPLGALTVIGCISVVLEVGVVLVQTVVR